MVRPPPPKNARRRPGKLRRRTIQRPRTSTRRPDRCYRRLRRNPRHTKHRDLWLACIEKYRAVFRHNPTGPLAPQGLYMTAKLYREMYRYSFRSADRQEAVELLRHIAARFPGSPYAPQAENDLAAMGVALTSAPSPRGPVAADKAGSDGIGALIAGATPTPGPAPGATTAGTGPATVSGLRFWSNPSYTRVVVDVTDDTEYNPPAAQQGPRRSQGPNGYLSILPQAAWEKTCNARSPSTTICSLTPGPASSMRIPYASWWTSSLSKRTRFFRCETLSGL